jgi:hypothetical protein
MALLLFRSHRYVIIDPDHSSCFYVCVSYLRSGMLVVNNSFSLASFMGCHPFAICDGGNYQVMTGVVKQRSSTDNAVCGIFVGD